MTRTRRILHGLAVGYTNQVLMTVVGLWLTTFLLTRLGQTDYGLWLIAMQILSYLMLMDFGVVGILPRETAFATGRAAGQADQATDLPDIIGRTTRMVLWQMPILALVAGVVWIGIPSDWEPLRRPLGIVMITFVVFFPFRILQAVLNGLQQLSFLSTVSTVRWALATSVTVGLVIAGFGIDALAIGWVVGQVAAAALWWIRLRTRYRYVLPKRLDRSSRAQLKEWLTKGFWVSVGQLAQVFLAATDLIIIGRVLGPEAVVPYFCTAKLLTVLRNQPQLFVETASPALSELRAGAPKEHLSRVCTAIAQAILLISGSIFCVVLAINEGFVTWWVGSDQYGGFALTVLLLAGMVLRHWNTTAAYTVYAFGRDRRLSLTTLSDGIITIIVSVVLVSRMGPIGAAIGTIVGACLVSLPSNLHTMAQETGTTLWGLIRPLVSLGWRFALLAAGATAVALTWAPSRFGILFAIGLGTVIIYGALMWPIAYRDPLGTYVRPVVASVRRRVPRLRRATR
jgi:O-antigen/teichoic acid export membrane protein